MVYDLMDQPKILDKIERKLVEKRYDELTDEEKQIVETDYADRKTKFESILAESEISDEEHNALWFKIFGESLYAKIVMNTPKDVYDAELDAFLKDDSMAS